MKRFGCNNFNSYYNGIQALCFKWNAFQRLPLSFYSSSVSTSKEGNKINPSLSIPNYLVESLGFSTHQSLSTYSKLLKRRGRIEADSNWINNTVTVVNFFKKLGMKNPDIRKMVSREPRVLTAKVEKTLKPKINLLLDLGFGKSDLILTVSKHPGMLYVDLGPVILALKTVLGCDKDVISALMRTNGHYISSVCKYCIANFEILQKDYGIPKHKIQKFFLRNPRPFLLKTDTFRDRLIKVEEKLGIPRDCEMFLYGMWLVCYTGKNIEDKCKIFRSLGWTQSDVAELIRRNPMWLTAAEGNIKERLDVLMNQMGFEPYYLASQPRLFTCSIKMKLLPRHKVLQILKEKGIVKMDYSFVSAIVMSESYFLKRFVLPFEEVHQVYAQLTGRLDSSLLKEEQKTNSKSDIVIDGHSR